MLIVGNENNILKWLGVWLQMKHLNTNAHLVGSKRKRLFFAVKWNGTWHIEVRKRKSSISNSKIKWKRKKNTILRIRKLMLVNIDSAWIHTYIHTYSHTHMHIHTNNINTRKQKCLLYKTSSKKLEAHYLWLKGIVLPTRQSAKWLMISLSGEMCQQWTKKKSLLLVPKKGTYYIWT